MPNYDSSAVGVPYVRVPRIVIEYPSPGVAHIRINEALAVKLADSSVAKLEDRGDLQWTITGAEMSQSLQLVHPDTAAAIPGATMTYQQIMLGLLAAIRTQQVARDAAAEPQA